MIEFDKLIQKGLSDYKNHLIAKSHGDFEKLLHQNQVDAYHNFLKLIAIKTDPTILQEISNPYYIGMGNPDSNILIFGQELAIELDKTKISSLQGFFQEQLYHHLLLRKPVHTFFDPYKANDYRKIKRHSHTWGVYSKWVAAFQDGHSEQYKKYLFAVPREHYFEDNCFYTELYDVPSPNHLNSKTSSERESFFKSEEFRVFFESFDYVFIGCKSFHQDYEGLLDKYFGINKSDILKKDCCNHLNKYGKPYINGKLLKTIKNKKLAIFKRQFSSAWKYEYINEVVNKLKNL